MPTRRDVLRLAATLPFSSGGGLTLITKALRVPKAGSPSVEHLRVRMPLPTRGEVWFFNDFTSAALPHRIEVIKAEAPWWATRNLEQLAKPATIRLLTQALTQEHPNVRETAIVDFVATYTSDVITSSGKAVPSVDTLLTASQMREGLRKTVRFLHLVETRPDSHFSLMAAVSSRHRSNAFKADNSATAIADGVAHLGPELQLSPVGTLSIFQPECPDVAALFVHRVLHQYSDRAVSPFNVKQFTEKALPALRMAIHDGDLFHLSWHWGV